MRRQGVVPRCARRRERCRRRARCRTARFWRVRFNAIEPVRVSEPTSFAGCGHERSHRVRQQLGLVRHVLGRPGVGADVAALGLDIEHGDGHLVARHAVDRRVVGLREHRDVAVLEAFDDPRLPQRLPPVERPGDDLLGQGRELAHASRLGHRDVVEMEVEVEVRVFDPDRVVHSERHFDEPPAERRREVQPRRVHVAHLVERPLHRCRRGIEDHEPRDVHVRRRCLEVEEAGVEAGQSLHDSPFDLVSRAAAQPVRSARGHPRRGRDSGGRRR